MARPLFFPAIAGLEVRTTLAPTNQWGKEDRNAAACAGGFGDDDGNRFPAP